MEKIWLARECLDLYRSIVTRPVSKFHFSILAPYTLSNRRYYPGLHPRNILDVLEFTSNQALPITPHRIEIEATLIDHERRIQPSDPGGIEIEHHESGMPRLFRLSLKENELLEIVMALSGCACCGTRRAGQLG